MTSPAIGGVGGTAYSFSCPSGKFINRIDGSVLDWNTGITFKCNDGTQSNWSGLKVGNTYTEYNPAGFSGVANGYGDKYVNSFQMFKADGTVGPQHGGSGGKSQIPSGGWKCPAGQKISKVDVLRGYVNKLVFTCSKPDSTSTAPATTTSASTTSTSTAPATTTVSTTSASSPVIGGSGGNAFSFSCPNGKFINHVAGRSGTRNDGIRFFCDDGSQSDWYGSTSAGSPYEEVFDSGFSGLNIGRGGTYVDSYQLKRSDGTSGGIRGTGTGGSNQLPSGGWKCPTGQKISRADGRASDHLNQLKFICSIPTAPAQPPPDPTKQAPIEPPPQTQPPADTAPPAPVVDPNQLFNQPPTQPVQQSSNSYTWILVLFFIFVVVIAIMYSMMAPPSVPMQPIPSAPYLSPAMSNQSYQMSTGNYGNNEYTQLYSYPPSSQPYGTLGSQGTINMPNTPVIQGYPGYPPNYPGNQTVIATNPAMM